MRRFGCLALVLAFFALAAVPAAQAEKRIALLIGNKDYRPGVGALVNPLNDIRIVSGALNAVGFEVLKPVQNGSRAVMLRAIHDFALKLKGAGPDAVGFLYYSGHGIASAGENYLIPIDVEEPSTVELNVQGVKQSEVLAILRGEAPNAAQYLVLDACRNTLQGARGGKGFLPVGQQSGVLVAFAAEPGKTASDTGAGSGPYAAALAAELVKPGQSDLIMFHHVRVAVMEKTSGDQVPWTEDGIQRRERVLFGGEGTPTPTRAQEAIDAAREWVAVDKTSMAELETFVRRHPTSTEADYAKARIESLRRQTASTASPSQPAKPGLVPGLLKDTVGIVLPGEQPARCNGVEAEIGSERHCLKPKDAFRDCETCPEMVVVPAGRFTMGSPRDEPEREGTTFEVNAHNSHKGSEGQRLVTISKPFAVGRFAVTRGEFAAFVVATGHKTEGGCYAFTGSTWELHVDRDWRLPGFNQTDRHPATCINWADAKAYVAWIAAATGKNYRLLSDTEREYVTRAGTTTPFWWGASITPKQANYDGSAEPYKGGGTKGEWRKATVPVDSFVMNPWGLYNVHGNVWEWTEDCWNESNTGNPGDGSARIIGDCSRRVVRGGSWREGPQFLRAAFRGWNTAVNRNDYRGFRLARTLAP